MQTIFKYELDVIDRQVLTVPKGSTVLNVKEQHGKMVLYVLCDATVEGDARLEVRIHGTGHYIAEDIKNYGYVDTVMLHGGAFAWHVFTRFQS
jgi:hypothetical protein